MLLIIWLPLLQLDVEQQVRDIAVMDTEFGTPVILKVWFPEKPPQETLLMHEYSLIGFPL